MKKTISIRIMGERTLVNKFIDILNDLNINYVSKEYKNHGSEHIRIYTTIIVNDDDTLTQIGDKK